MLFINQIFEIECTYILAQNTLVEMIALNERKQLNVKHQLKYLKLSYTKFCLSFFGVLFLPCLNFFFYTIYKII